MVPWEVPEISRVDRYAEVLLRWVPSDLVFTQRRFVLVCRRPGRSQVTALDQQHVPGGEVVARTLVARAAVARTPSQCSRPSSTG